MQGWAEEAGRTHLSGGCLVWRRLNHVEIVCERKERNPPCSGDSTYTMKYRSMSTLNKGSITMSHSPPLPHIPPVSHPEWEVTA